MFHTSEFLIPSTEGLLVAYRNIHHYLNCDQLFLLYLHLPPGQRTRLAQRRPGSDFSLFLAIHSHKQTQRFRRSICFISNGAEPTPTAESAIL